MLAVISAAGKKLEDVVIETNGQALIEAIRTIPGRKHLCLEEGTQSAWFYEILQPRVHELVVTTVPKNRGKKSDKADARKRTEELLLERSTGLSSSLRRPTPAFGSWPAAIGPRSGTVSGSRRA